MAKKLDERGPGDAEEPDFIQTIPKQGYRLVAPVSWEEVKETPLTKSESVATAGLAPSRVDAGGTVAGYAGEPSARIRARRIPAFAALAGSSTK